MKVCIKSSPVFPWCPGVREQGSRPSALRHRARWGGVGPGCGQQVTGTSPEPALAGWPRWREGHCQAQLGHDVVWAKTKGCDSSRLRASREAPRWLLAAHTCIAPSKPSCPHGQEGQGPARQGRQHRSLSAAHFQVTSSATKPSLTGDFFGSFCTLALLPSLL